MTARLLRLTFTLAALGATLLAPAAARAGHTQRSIFEDDARLIYSDDATRTATLDELSGLGVDTIRVPIVWNRVAPAPTAKAKPGFDATDPSAYPVANWHPYDAVVRGATARGMTVLFTLTAPAPRWAEGCRAPGRPGICKPDVKEFGSFARAVGTRYSGSFADETGGGVLPRVTRWSIYNEPNLYRWLYPQLVHHKGRVVNFAAARYRALFRAGAAALHATSHAKDTILIGETSPVGNGGGTLASHTTPPITFLKAVMCLNGAGHRLRGAAARAAYCGGRFRRLPATGIAHHPYTPAAACNPRCKGGAADATIASLNRLAAVSDHGARAGRLRRHAPIWLTEFGFESTPPDRFSGISLTEQAKYINWADYLAFRSPRVKTVAQYELYDDTREGTFQTGLRRSSGKLKPSWAAYRMPIFVVGSGKRHVRVFGQVRPAGSARVLVQRRARHKGPWRTVAMATRNGAGYINRRLARHGGSWRLSWRPAPGRPVLHSRTAGVD